MKLRVLIVSGALAAMAVIPAAAAHAGVSQNNGNCGTTAPTPPAGATGLPDGGQAWAPTPSVPPSAGSLSGGIEGPHGYLVGTGSGDPTPPPSGTLTVFGSQTESGLNGTATVTNAGSPGASACIGVIGQSGVSVSAP